MTRLSGRSIGLLLTAAVALAGSPAQADYDPAPALRDVPRGIWAKIHQQRPGDAVTFPRQQHGGSAIDTRRGRLVLFGSDTHDAAPGTSGWLNSPRFFDLATLSWRQAYPDDALSSYRIADGGHPVAGPGSDHPWSMHSWGSVAYDEAADTVIVASYPRHMVPGRFTDVYAELWPRIRRQPTWLYAPASGRWSPLAAPAKHFYPFSVSYDPAGRRVLGYRNDEVFALALPDGRWRQLATGGAFLGWGSNTAFDTRHGVLVAYGSHDKPNHVTVFDTASGALRRMPTPGIRPPGDIYVPMAFHAALGRTAIVVDRPAKGRSETWLYDYAADAWTEVASARLPFTLGMNFNLEYAPRERLLLLVATPPGETLPAVWALRLEDADVTGRRAPTPSP